MNRMRRKTKGFTLIELLVVIAIIAILAAILFPIYAKAKESARKATCVSNMKQIGNAFRMYIGDYEDTFPTNRSWADASKSALGPIIREVWLSLNTWDPDGDQIPDRFEKGAPYVEGLYPYLERIVGSEDPATIWKCPKAKASTYPKPSGRGGADTASSRAAVTYAMNFYMVEANEGMLKSTADVMLLREMDAKVNSILRPTETPVGAIDPAPNCPFLCSEADAYGIPKTELKPQMHANGSHLLFADGHAKYYKVSEMSNIGITTAKDAFGRWTNADGNIVITPSL